MARGFRGKIRLNGATPRRDKEAPAIDVQAVGVLQLAVLQPDGKGVILQHINAVRHHLDHEHPARVVDGQVVQEFRAFSGPGPADVAGCDINGDKAVDVRYVQRIIVPLTSRALRRAWLTLIGFFRSDAGLALNG